MPLGRRFLEKQRDQAKQGHGDGDEGRDHGHAFFALGGGDLFVFQVRAAVE